MLNSFMIYCFWLGEICFMPLLRHYNYMHGDDNFELFTADDKRNAMVYLKIIESFEFIFCIVNPIS